MENALNDNLLETKKCRYGLVSFFKNDTVIGSSLREYGEWAQNEIDFLLQLIQPGDIVFDVGAFIGTHTLAFAQKVGQTGRVYSSEPNPFSFEVLQLNKKQNHLLNVECEEVALSNRATTMRLNLSSWDESNPGATTLLNEDEVLEKNVAEVQNILVQCLDQYTVPDCRLIKIDTEGMESKILEGGLNFVKTHRPYIYAECLSVANGAKFFSFMEKEEYIGFIHSVLAYSPTNINNNPDNIFGSAREVNIILVPVEKDQSFQNSIENYHGVIPFNTLDDLVLAMINKPQYKEEILVKTSAAEVLGVNYFLSEGENMSNQPNVEEERIHELTSQIETKNEYIQELTTQIETKNEYIQELTSQVEAKIGYIQELASQVEAKIGQTQELISQIETKDMRIQEFTSRIEKVENEHHIELEQIIRKHKDDLLKKNQALQAVLSRLARKEDELHSQENTVESVKAEYAALKQEAETFSAKLWEIQHSRSWKVVQKFWKLRVKLLPLGSLRIRILQGIKNGMKVLFTEGVMAFVKYLHAKSSSARKANSIEVDQPQFENKAVTTADLFDHPNPVYTSSQKIELQAFHEITSSIEVDNSDFLWERVEKSIKNRSFLISISHDDYLTVNFGGSQMFMADEQNLLDKSGVSYIHMYPVSQNDYLNNASSLVVGLNVDTNHIGQYPVGDIAHLLSALLYHDYKCLSVNLHQFKGWTFEGLKSVISSAQSQHLIFYVHDYYSVCPQYTLLRNNREFCNAPELDSHACNICAFGDKRKIHLPLAKELFASFPFMIVSPSKSALAIWQKTFAGFSGQVRIEPHLKVSESPTLLPVKSNKVIRIAYAGQPTRNKGWELWREIVEEYFPDANYKLFHLGMRYEKNAEEFESVRVSADHRTAMMDALRRNQIDVLIHCPILPETFSYVLYEAIGVGCFILTNTQSGNIADYVRENGNGIVFESNNDLLAYLSNPDNLRKDLARFCELHPNSKIIEQNNTIPCLITSSLTEK